MMISYYRGVVKNEISSVVWIEYDHKHRELTYGFKSGARHIIPDIYVFEVFDDAQGQKIS